MSCKHNQRRRYTHGFYCKDCDTFFNKNSATYRKDELLSSVWMVLNNINVDLFRAHKDKDMDVTALMNRIGIGKNHDDDYEELLLAAELLMSKYQKDENSASMTLTDR